MIFSLSWLTATTTLRKICEIGDLIFYPASDNRLPSAPWFKVIIFRAQGNEQVPIQSDLCQQAGRQTAMIRVNKRMHGSPVLSSSMAAVESSESEPTLSLPEEGR